jgi:hypothetical protein
MCALLRPWVSTCGVMVWRLAAGGDVTGSEVFTAMMPAVTAAPV